VELLRAQKSFYRGHYDVDISDEAIAAAVVFAINYFKGRALPYSAVNILEDVCAHHSLTEQTSPIGVQEIAQYGARLYPRFDCLDFLNRSYPALLQRSS
jgi:ATP-dependent Clp protease ATP-binding subunit ClpA